MKIDVNNFCNDEIATKDEAKKIYEKIKELKNEVIELNFADVKILHLDFFEEFLGYYYPKIKYIKMKNLNRTQIQLLKEALRYLRYAKTKQKVV